MTVFTDFLKKKKYWVKTTKVTENSAHTSMAIWSKSSANKPWYLKEVGEDLCNATESICTLFITAHTAAENFTPVNENESSFHWRWLNTSDTNVCSRAHNSAHLYLKHKKYTYGTATLDADCVYQKFLTTYHK